MFYKPGSGSMWDPSVIWHDGRYHMFCMHMDEGTASWNGMWLALSEDGVHWKDYGRVLEEELPVCKMFVYRQGDRFGMNMGSISGRTGYGNDTLRYFESEDLIHWKHLYDNHPDPKWYDERERWDHMYVIPKNEERPEDGYWGYVVATPAGEAAGAWGMQESQDGVSWNPIEPPEILWGKLPPSREFEGGGCERIGDRYYYIGGGCPPYAGNFGYGVYTFTADNPAGPFKPDLEAFRLCGFSGLRGRVFVQTLAAFCRGEKEILVSNSILAPAPDGAGPDENWLLPLRKAVVDPEGHLRLGYWKQNDAIKGKQLELTKEEFRLLYTGKEKAGAAQGEWEAAEFTLSSDLILGMKTESLAQKVPLFDTQYQLFDSHMVAVLDRGLDIGKGIVLEGTFQASVHPERGEVRARCWRPSAAGFYLEENPGSGTAVMMEVGDPLSRKTHIGRIHCAEDFSFESLDVTGPGCATVTGLDNGKKHAFRLFLRRNMFELYIDDLLVQTFFTAGMPSGRLGFVVQNAACILEDIRVWEMNDL